MEELATAIGKEGIHARGVLRFGNPARELVQAVKDEGIDFLVLRSHGHGVLADLLLGHTIEKIRHRAAVPVLAVR